jgi:hypothetical protein
VSITMTFNMSVDAASFVATDDSVSSVRAAWP